MSLFADGMARLPARGPGFAEIVQMADDLLGLEADRGAAGEVELQRARDMPDCQQYENAVALAEAEAAPPHRRDAADAESGEAALAAPLPRRRRRPLPEKSIGDDGEAPLLRQISHLRNRDERILKDRRYDREVLGVPRQKLQRIGRRRAFRHRRRRARYRRRTPRASPRAARSRDPGDRRG